MIKVVCCVSFSKSKSRLAREGFILSYRKQGWSSGDTTLLSPMGPDILPSLSIFFQPAERFGLKFYQLLPLVKTQMNKFATLVNPVVKNNYNDDDGALGLGFFRVYVSPRISCCCSSFPIIYMMRMIMIIIAINFTIISDQVVNGSRAAKHKVEIPPLL